MNYHIEIFGYWLLLMIFITWICKEGYNLVKKHLPKRWYFQFGNSSYLNDDLIDRATSIIFIGLLAFVTIAPIYPTPLSVPTVEISAKGEIKPLPFGAWIWDVPNYNTYGRLVETLDCNQLYIRGRTSDGVQVTINITFTGSSLSFRLRDPTVFYRYYKTGGVDSFCTNLREVVVAEVFLGKEIYPESKEQLIADIEQKQLAFESHLREVFKQNFNGRGVVLVEEE